MAIQNVIVEDGTFKVGAAPGDGGAGSASVVDVAFSASQLGSTWRDVGVIYLEPGVLLAAQCRFWMGVDNASDNAEVELRNATTSALLATITKTGAVGGAQPSADINISAAGYYAIRLRASTGLATAFLFGVHLVYEGGAAAEFLDTTHTPVALYTLDGDLLDSSGNGYNLTIGAGNAFYGPAPVTDAQAIFFNGLSRAQRASYDAGLDLKTALTLEALVFPQVVHNADAYLINFSGSGDTEPVNILYQLLLTSGNRVRYLHEAGAGIDYGFTFDDAHVPVGQWSHIAVTRDSAGTGIVVYVNGVERGSTTLGAAPTGGSSSQLALGQFIGGSFGFTGMMSSAKIIASELTSSQVLSEARRSLPPELRA